MDLDFLRNEPYRFCSFKLIGQQAAVFSKHPPSYMGEVYPLHFSRFARCKSNPPDFSGTQPPVHRSKTEPSLLEINQVV